MLIEKYKMKVKIKYNKVYKLKITKLIMNLLK